jgi:hypothetical protein
MQASNVTVFPTQRLRTNAMTIPTSNRLRSTLIAAATQALFLAAPVLAAPPTRIPLELDETFQSRFLSNACGVPVWVHIEGTGTITLFYSRNGALIRELQTYPQGVTSTYYSPVELGGTGKSLTQVIHSPITILYPDGTEIGDPAIAIYNGVQLTAGPGNARIVGHEVREAVIVGFTPEGTPLIEEGEAITQAGQFDVAPVVEARCELLTDP